MRAWRVAAVFALLCGAASAQENQPAQATQPAAQNSPEDDVRQHFDLVASRATAIFQAAESIDERLKGQGATLHPQIAALRMRVDAAMREARVALDKGKMAAAENALKRADALLDKFAVKMGWELTYAVRHFLSGGRRLDRSNP